MTAHQLTSHPEHALRTRYFPKSRLGQGFVSGVPWFNILLLFFFFYWLHNRLVVQPGSQIHLPQVPLTTATRSDLTAVLHRPSPVTHTGGPLLYFDDHVFDVSRSEDLTAFRTLLAPRAASSQNRSMVLFVDASFTFDVVTVIMNEAREAGIREINLASQPPSIARSPVEP